MDFEEFVNKGIIKDPTQKHAGLIQEIQVFFLS